MTVDPGHPFSRLFADLVASLEDSLQNGVGQPARATLVFKSSITAYDLPIATDTVTSVSGILGGKFKLFVAGADYDVAHNKLIWRDPPGTRPDDSSRIEVEYTYRDPPAGITDFNPGSVAGTLVRAVARELKLLYEQTDQAYRRSFIDVAAGVALDNVVAVLGVRRNQATKASGYVTFSCKDPPTRPVLIPLGTRVTDTAGRAFLTTADAQIAAPAKSADVPVEAENAGPEGNVSSVGSITIMPKPPAGVKGVTNGMPITGGQPAEPDDQLRERARHALERAGNATPNAIKFAVLEIDGVDGVEVIDNGLDPSIPVGEVRVRYSISAGDEARRDVIATSVRDAVERTRAAGIMARYETIQAVLVAGTFYVFPDATGTPGAAAAFKAAAVAAIKALRIGEPLSVRKINALVYNVAGLADVAEAQLEAPKGTPAPDPLLVKRTEQAQPDEANLAVVVLTALQAGAVRNGARQIDVSLVGQGGPASFKSLSLAATIGIRARLLRAPEETPERIGSPVPHTLAFTNSTTATLTLGPDDLSGFRSADHDPALEVTIAATLYPALTPATATLTITP